MSQRDRIFIGGRIEQLVYLGLLCSLWHAIRRVGAEVVVEVR